MASDEQSHTPTEATGAGYFLIDRRGCFQHVNRAWLAMHGYSSADEVVGRHFSITQVAEDLDQATAIVNALLAGAPVAPGEFARRCKDGSVGYHTFSASPVRRDNEVVGLEGFLIDVTARALAERSIHHSEARYRELFNATGNGVVVYRAVDDGGDFVIEDFNQAAERLEQTTREQVVGRRVTEVFPGVGDFGLLDVMRRVWKTGTPGNHPMSFYQDGRIAGWRENFVYRLPSGEVVAVYEDVTRRLQAEQRLKDQVTFLQTILDAIPSPVFYKDVDGRYIGCNKAFATFLGHAPEQIVGKTVFDLSSSSLAATYGARDAELLRTNVTQAYEGLIPCANGALRNAEIHKAVYRNSDGAVAGIVGTWLDITERKQAVETLRENEDRFRRIFDEGPIGMATTRPDFHFIRANAAFCEMLGYSEPELASLTFKDLTHPADIGRDTEAVAELVRAEIQVYRTEKRYIRKNQEVVWGALTLSAIRDRDGRILYFLAMVRDISKQVVAEQALKESNRELWLRNQITEAFLLAPHKEIFRRVLDIVLSHTGSRHGLFGYLDEAGTIVAPALTRDVWAARTNGTETIRFPRERWEASMWSRAVLEKRTVHDNAPGQVPAGHHPMRSLLAVPILFQDAVIGLFVVANKDGGYSDADHATLEHIALHIAPMLHSRLEAEQHEAGRRRAEDEQRDSLKRVRSAMGGIVQAMVMAVEARDPYTAGHQRRVARLATAIAEEMGLPPDSVDGIRYASIIHDIGKISVPAEILSKPMRLSAPELNLVQTHSQSGYDILKDIDFPWPIATIVLQHHERMDGSGYPGSLRGDEIRVEARVLGVADVVDAIASHRPYRPALGIEAAIEELLTLRGEIYDASAVDACVRLFRERGFVLKDLG